MSTINQLVRKPRKRTKEKSNVPALEGSSLTLSARNLATFTGYSGIDPELNYTGGNSNFTQAEFNTMPPPRILTARLDLRF